MRRFIGAVSAACLGIALLGGVAAISAGVAPEVPVLPVAHPAPAQSDSEGDAALTQQLANSNLFLIRHDHWTAEDEREYGEFIAAIGNSGCHTVNACLHGKGNPFRASDPAGAHFFSDCAELPYVLRAYFAFKKGLPFSYESAVAPRGHTRDIRYTAAGNKVVERRDVLSASSTGYGLLPRVATTVNSASFRIHPDLDDPVPDMYSPAISPKSIRPGTMFYDPNGHVATIYKIDGDGRIYYIDAHPDYSVTRGNYDARFVRARPGMGAGFKNWRQVTLVGYTKRSDGVLMGGHMVLPKNKDIPDFSTVQFFGTGARPADDSEWASGRFVLNGESMGYYDYVRAVMAGGKLEFDPVKEVAAMVDSNCADLHYRGDAIDVAIAAGTERVPEPEQLPANIYGTDGLWETYSTPSRDARLKTAFKELRDQVERFVQLYRTHDPKLKYQGNDLAGDLLKTYDAHAAMCTVTYTRSDGSKVTFDYNEARRRLFAMSFDPYHCIERRWGAHTPSELATCKDGANKSAWYKAEQNLRNQLERTYDVRMDYSLTELQQGGPGRGVAQAPDVDVRAYLATLASSGPSAMNAASARHYRVH